MPNVVRFDDVGFNSVELERILQHASLEKPSEITTLPLDCFEAAYLHRLVSNEIDERKAREKLPNPFPVPPEYARPQR